MEQKPVTKASVERTSLQTLQSGDADSTVPSSSDFKDDDKNTTWHSRQDSGSALRVDHLTDNLSAQENQERVTVLPSSNRKRKRGDGNDNLEGAYMDRLAREEAKEDVKRQQERGDKRLKLGNPKARDNGTGSDDEVRSALSSDQPRDHEDPDQGASPVPQHESLNLSTEDIELEKASRTVFLANVSTMAIKSKSSKRLLLEHLSSFLPFLPSNTPPQKVESLRFRSTAFATNSVPKKASYVKKDLMDATTKSTNAYAVFTTSLAAREAVKRLNGTVVLDRHLRVDSVAHPAKIDHRRCVFVGNLGFVDNESMIKAAEDKDNNKKPRKSKEPADIEEGLWRQFSKAGTVESVRVVRDKTTRVGKGIAYIQFQESNAVEKALLFNEKKFPPMLPRILRVTRAKSINKTGSYNNAAQSPIKTSSVRTKGIYEPKVSSEVQSLSGRAGKLLGRAGAAQFRNGRSANPRKTSSQHNLKVVKKSPEAIVFEGYRASSKQGKGTMKLGVSGKKHGKPRTRSSRRGAAFKASAGKKLRS